MNRRISRREFVRGTAAGVGFWAAPRLLFPQDPSPNAKLNIACIGVAGKGDEDTDDAGAENIVALCDVDRGRLGKKAEKFPQAKKYQDYRKMLDEMGDKIDAVTVSTPDHHHAPAAMMALKLKKHVFCQKPLTHTVREARLLRETAAQMKVATQMGNQGTADGGLRRAVEIVRSGAIGDVKEVHIWTNRPVWPQSPQITARPRETPPVTAELDWNDWLGPAPQRPYNPCYHPFGWRGWWDFGTGALGDMACHTANLPNMALQLTAPTSVSAESEPLNPETYPGWAKVMFEFPARGTLPPVKVMWYEGKRNGQLVLPPAGLLMGEQFSGSGSLTVGSKGTLFSGDDYGATNKLLPTDRFKDFKDPEPTLPRSRGHFREWVEACKGGKPALSNFDYAGLLTEWVLLGNVAIKLGAKFRWESEKFRADSARANALLGKEYRRGWTL